MTAPRSFVIWLGAIRPKTLPAALSPLLVAWGLAHNQRHVHRGVLVAAALGAVLIQIGTNLFNDWADFHRGADASDRLGPARASQQGWLSARAILGGCAAAYTGAVVCGLYLLPLGGWRLVAVGLASLHSGLAYTGGPLPLAYTGLADFFVVLFFGPVAVCTTVWLQGAAVNFATWLLGAASGLWTLAILVVNNLRDRDSDRRANKKTLAVRFGATFARIEYTLCLAVGLALGAWALALLRGPRHALWAGVMLPVVVAQMWACWRRDGRALNALLARTALVEAGAALGIWWVLR